MNQPHAQCYAVGTVRLLWCSVCGPMGVSTAPVDESMVREHLMSHFEEDKDD